MELVYLHFFFKHITLIFLFVLVYFFFWDTEIFFNTVGEVFVLLGIGYFFIASIFFGFYYDFCSTSTAFILHFTGISRVTRYSLYNEFIIHNCMMLLNYAYLLYFKGKGKEEKKNVYLIWSKKSMFCAKNYVRQWSGVRHWAIIVEAKPGLYYLFDARGSAFIDLESCWSIKSRKKLLKRYSGFKKLGRTTPELLQKVIRGEYNLDGCKTCQQFANRVGNVLVRPVLSPWYLIRFYGRVSFYVVVSTCFSLVLSNVILGTNFDVDYVYMVYILWEVSIDYQFWVMYVYEFNWKCVIEGVIAGSLYLFLTFSQILHRPGGLWAVKFTSVLITYFFVQRYVKKFPFCKESTEGKMEEEEDRAKEEEKALISEFCGEKSMKNKEDKEE